MVVRSDRGRDHLADALKQGLSVLKTARAEMGRGPEKAGTSDYGRMPEEIERLFGGFDLVEGTRVRLRRRPDPARRNFSIPLKSNRRWKP